MAATLRIDWEQTLSNRGSTRATAYMASNKLLSREGTVFASWLDTTGTTRIQAIAEEGEPATEQVVLHEGIDNHCGPALTVDREGYLHVMAGSHNDRPFAHRVSREPWNIDYWWPPVPVADSPTYPSMAPAADGSLHLTYRWWRGISTANSPNRYRPAPSLGYQRATPEFSYENLGHKRGRQNQWSKPVELLVPLVPNGYCQYGSSFAVDSRGSLHLGFHVYDQSYTGRGHTVGYLRSDDGGDTWRKASGDEVTLPCGPTTADTLESGENLDMRASNVAVTPDGNPALVAFHREDGNAVLWEHDGSQWHRTDLLPVLREHTPNCFSMDGTLSIDAEGNTYIAAQRVMERGNWGTPDARVVVLFRAAGADDWQVLEIPPVDDVTPCWHPSLERITGPTHTIGVPYLLYTAGSKGDGCETYNFTQVRLVRLAID